MPLKKFITSVEEGCKFESQSLYRLSTMSDSLQNIELLPVATTRHIQHSWLEVEDHLKQAGNIMFKRYIICTYVLCTIYKLAYAYI